MALPQSWRGHLQASRLVTSPACSRARPRGAGRLERAISSCAWMCPKFDRRRAKLNSATNRLVMAILSRAMYRPGAAVPSLHLESWRWDVVTWLIVIGFVFVSVVAFC